MSYADNNSTESHSDELVEIEETATEVHSDELAEIENATKEFCSDEMAKIEKATIELRSDELVKIEETATENFSEHINLEEGSRTFTSNSSSASTVGFLSTQKISKSFSFDPTATTTITIVSGEENDMKVEIELKDDRHTPWGLTLNLQDKYDSWMVQQVTKGLQADAEGIEPGWRLIKVGNQIITAKNAQKIQKQLEEGIGCKLTFQNESNSDSDIQSVESVLDETNENMDSSINIIYYFIILLSILAGCIFVYLSLQTTHAESITNISNVDSQNTTKFIKTEDIYNMENENFQKNITTKIDAQKNQKKTKKDTQQIQKFIEGNKPEHIENANDKNNAKVILQDQKDIATSDDEKIEEDKELMQKNVKKFIQYYIIPKFGVSQYLHSQEIMSTLIKTVYDDFVADKSNSINQSLREDFTKSTKSQKTYLKLIQGKCTDTFGDYNKLIRKNDKDECRKVAAIVTLIIIGVTCFAISCVIFVCDENCCCCNKCSKNSQYFSYIGGAVAAFGVVYLLIEKIYFS